MSIVNISIDDVSPHPMSSVKVLDRCHELITIFPDIKFTLFVPIAYWRTTRREIATKFPLQIDQFRDFCKTIEDLSDTNFEIGYHGLFHGIPGKSDNDEFQYLSYEEALEKIEIMFRIVENSGLSKKFKKIFRPPAWRMSPDATRALRDTGFEILALSPKDYALKTYGEEYKKKKDVVFYNSNPPFDPLKIEEKTEIVYHACEWDKNYLSSEMKEQLSEFLLTNRQKFRFCFMKEML